MNGSIQMNDKPFIFMINEVSIYGDQDMRKCQKTNRQITAAVAGMPYCHTYIDGIHMYNPGGMTVTHTLLARDLESGGSVLRFA